MSTTTTSPTVTSRIVTRFLEIRSGARGRKQKAALTLGKVVEKLDPRATLEDYLRRKQRLDTTVSDLEEDDMTLADPVLAKAVQTAKNAIKTIEDNRAKAKTPDNKKDRAKLQDVSVALDKAVLAAGKRADKRREEQPKMTAVLDRLEAKLADPDLRATPEDVAGWKARLSEVNKEFYADKPDYKAVGKTLEQLAVDVNSATDDALRRETMFRKKQAALTNKLAKAQLPTEALARADLLLQAAGRMAGMLDFDAADKGQADAEKILGTGPVSPPPSMDECEQRRLKLHAQALKLVAPADGKTGKWPDGAAKSDVGRKGAVTLLHELDGLRGLCAQGDEVALEAARRLDMLEQRLGDLTKKDGAAANWSATRDKTGKAMEQRMDQLRSRMVVLNPRDGELAALETRFGLLEAAHEKLWPGIMVQDDLDKSGLMKELGAIEQALAQWAKLRNAQTGNAEGLFRKAVSDVQRVTDAAREANFGLIAKHGLDGAVPKQVAAGELLLSERKRGYPAKLKTITEELQKVVKAVENDLASEDPLALEKKVSEARMVVGTLDGLIGQNVKMLEGALPNKVRGGAQKALKKVLPGSTTDADEVRCRISYAEAMQQDLLAITALLSCKDPTVVQGAIEQLTAMKSRMDDLAAMAKTAKATGKPAAPGLPLFTAINKALVEVEKTLAKHGKDTDGVATRVEVLSGWNERAAALRNRIGHDDPRVLDEDVKKLAQEIETKTAEIKQDIKAANEQYALLLRLEQSLVDSKPGQYPDLREELLRLVIGMKETVKQWKQLDAGYADLLKRVQQFLKATPDQNDKDAMAKANGEAAATEKAVGEAELRLRALRDADLPLYEERFKKVEDKGARKLLLSKLGDMKKEAERAFDTLRENRDPKATMAFVKSVLRELDEAEAGPTVDHVTNRGQLTKLDQVWKDSVSGIRSAMDELAEAVTKAAESEDQAIKDAAGQIDTALFRPVRQLFSPDSFTACIKGMGNQDAKVRAANREVALREVRRLRRVLDSDDRIRLLTLDNPFGKAVPFPLLSSALFDIEVNVTRATGGGE